jgi:hypothetical protein
MTAEFNDRYGILLLPHDAVLASCARAPLQLNLLQATTVDRYMERIAAFIPGHSVQEIAQLALRNVGFRGVLLATVRLLTQRDSLSDMRYHLLTDKARYLNSRRLFQRIRCLSVLLNPRYGSRLLYDADELKE